ncbi:MAG: glycosyltransferase family 4 protein [Candidatus Omnitrophica bacterium]|nr:glycosyltransferase family 4 protein [Candidatus Omnitrophota bacterium]
MKIKVLHIITRLDLGGSATNTLETVKRLDKQKYDTHLISGNTSDPNHDIARYIKDNDIDCTFMPALQRPVHPLKDLLALYKIYRYLKKNSYDIVHTHSSKGGIIGRWAAKLAGVPVIIHTPHGHIYYGYFNAFLTRIFIFIEQLTAGLTDKIITLTNLGTKEHLDFKIAPADKFVTIYSGIHIPDYQASKQGKQKVREKFQLKPGHMIIGSVARLDPIKGNDILLEAFFRLQQEFPDCYLLLVGSGSQQPMLEERCKEWRIQDRVIFCGYQKNVADLINAMDIFVLASRNEGMGRVLLEAMACQKPIVASRTGGIPELIDDNKNGILVTPQQPEELYSALSQLLRQPDLRRQLGRTGFQRVNEKFSIEKMVSDIDGLYKKLLNSTNDIK